GDAGAGADLDDRTGVEDRREEAQHGAPAWSDRNDADLGRARSSGDEDVVLHHELFGVGPALSGDRLGGHGSNSTGSGVAAGNETLAPRVVTTTDSQAAFRLRP